MHLIQIKLQKTKLKKKIKRNNIILIIYKTFLYRAAAKIVAALFTLKNRWIINIKQGYHNNVV